MLPDRSRVVASFRDGRLTLQARDQSVERVFDELLQVTRIAVIPSKELTNARISVHMSDFPLEEGLRQILQDFDAFFFYEAGKGSPSALKMVWVYPKGRGRDVRPVPPESWASTRELRGRLGHSDPGARAAAIEELVERKDTGARDALLRGLADRSEKVRSHALYAARDHGVEIPPEFLMNLLLDPAENVRFLALEALARDANATAVAQTMLNDPSPHVQNKAKEILQQAEVAAGRVRPARPAQQQQGVK